MSAHLVYPMFVFPTESSHTSFFFITLFQRSGKVRTCLEWLIHQGYSPRSPHICCEMCVSAWETHQLVCISVTQSLRIFVCGYVAKRISFISFLFCHRANAFKWSDADFGIINPYPLYIQQRESCSVKASSKAWNEELNIVNWWQNSDPCCFLLCCQWHMLTAHWTGKC